MPGFKALHRPVDPCIGTLAAVSADQGGGEVVDRHDHRQRGRGGVGVIKGTLDGRGPAASFMWLAEEAVTRGDVVIQDIDVSNEELVGISLAAEVPVVKGVGVSTEVNRTSTRATRTVYLGRDGWQDWEGCW